MPARALVIHPDQDAAKQFCNVLKSTGVADRFSLATRVGKSVMSILARSNDAGEPFDKILLSSQCENFEEGLVTLRTIAPQAEITVLDNSEGIYQDWIEEKDIKVAPDREDGAELLAQIVAQELSVYKQERAFASLQRRERYKQLEQKLRALDQQVQTMQTLNDRLAQLERSSVQLQQVINWLAEHWQRIAIGFLGVLATLGIPSIKQLADFLIQIVDSID